MPWSPQREEESFHAALDIVSPTERDAYLRRVCGGDAAFEERMRQLLAHADTSDALLGADHDPEDEPAGMAEGPGSVIDRYRLLGRLGEGAMGTVFEAKQTHPFQKRVALKVIKAGMDSREVSARFNAERQVLAMLEHPNVARVLDGGTTSSGRAYFVMELVRGEPITEFCDEGRLSLDERLELFIQVCQGVQHAHQRGIIHRDLKPGNVMVRMIDDRPVPVVIDFGVAKAIHQSVERGTLATRPGQAIGTPSAMSPEQVAGSEAGIDTRSDVYALGALLYELLTGTVPLPKTRQPGTGWIEIERSILEDAPLRPSRRFAALERHLQEEIARRRQSSPTPLRNSLRIDLDWIALKALEKNPDQRYATVSELNADVRRHLDCLPVSVSAPSWAYLAAKFVRRNRRLAATVGLLLLMALASGVVMLREAAETRRALVRADAALTELEERIVVSARELLDGGRVTEGLGLLADLARQRPEDRGLGAWLANELTYRNFPRPILPPIRHPDIVYAAHFSPDGQRLLTTCIDNSARVFDTASGRMVFPPLEHDARSVTPGRYGRGLHALRAGFNRAGTLIATASCDTTARVWDASTGQPITGPLNHPGLVSFAIFAPDDPYLVTGCSDGRVRFWNLPEGTPTGRELKHDDWVNWAEFSLDGRFLVTGADDRTARLWDAASGEPIGEPMRNLNIVQCARFSPNGRVILTVGSSHRGMLWDLSAWPVASPSAIELKHAENVPFGCFSDDGRWVATVSFDKTARIWSIADGRLQASVEHDGTVRFAEFSPDGLRLLTASEDGTAVVWDVMTGNRVMEPLHHEGKVWSARFSPDGDKVATASADGTVLLWDVRPGAAQPLVLVNDNKTVRWQDWSPDGQWIALVGSRHGIWSAIDGLRAGDRSRWPLSEAESVRFHPTDRVLLTGDTQGFAEARSYADLNESVVRVFHGDGPVVATWSPNGQRFLTTAGGSLIRVWDYPSGEPAHPELQEATQVTTAQFSPNGRWVVAALANGEIHVRRASDGESVARWKAHDQRITALAFSGDGLTLLSASDDHRAAIWSLPEGDALGPYLLHRGVVTHAALSRDGRWAITVSRDGTARRWAVEEGHPVGPPLRHRGALTVVHIDAQDRHFVTGSEDGTARVWDLTTGRPITPLLRHRSRVRNAQFSPDGTRLFVASDGNPTLWTIISPSSPMPNWLPELAELLAHRRWMADESEGAPLTSQPAVPRPGAGMRGLSDWDQWHQWFLSDRLARAHAPGGHVTMQGLSARRFRDLDVVWDPIRAELLRRALEFQPRHSLGLAQLEAFASLATAQPDPSSIALPDRALAGALLNDPYAAWGEALRRIRHGHRAMALEFLEPFLNSNWVDHPLFWFTVTQLLVEADRIQEAKQSFLRVTEGLHTYEGGHLPGLELRWALTLWGGHHANRRAFPDSGWFLRQACQIPDRSPDANTNHLDLSDHFNETLRFAWSRRFGTQYDLSELPQGLDSLGGIEFDLRGAIALASRRNPASFCEGHLPRTFLKVYCGPEFERDLDARLPDHIEELPLHCNVGRIHLLMTGEGSSGAKVVTAVLRVRYDDGRETHHDISYTVDLRDWLTANDGTVSTPPPVWIGTTHTACKLQLYRVTWDNPWPDVPVSTIDLTSTMTATGPILLAITIEP